MHQVPTTRKKMHLYASNAQAIVCLGSSDAFPVKCLKLKPRNFSQYHTALRLGNVVTMNHKKTKSVVKTCQSHRLATFKQSDLLIKFW